MNSPIIIFAFNRASAFSATVNSLASCVGADKSDLYIFVDGPRIDKPDDLGKVKQVRDIAKNIKGFKSVSCYFSDVNLGLGPSLIAGTSKVLNRYDRVIVLEDDLVVLPNFLCFMNQGLERYKEEKDVFSICGYTNDISVENNKYDAYACVRSSSWGWGTWKDRWESVDWELNEWCAVENQKKEFNRWGGSDCYGMLKGWKCGLNKSWAIRFCYSQFIQKKVSIFPTKSLVINNGFDGNGTNCKKWSRFKYSLMDKKKNSFNFPISVEINKNYLKQALSYHSIHIRILSKIAYFIYR